MKIRTEEWTAHFDEVPVDVRNAMRTTYRILRIRIPYAAPMSDDLDRMNIRSEGFFYGMDREQAKRFIADFLREVDWHAYLGTK